MSETPELFSEFGFIAGLRQACRPRDAMVDLGIGDDCAVLALGGGRCLLLTTDMLIDRVHFRLGTLSPFELGMKALAVNLSDIAAMGGRPVCWLLAAGLTPGLPADFLAELKRGLFSCAERYGADLVGGDTVIARADLCLSLTVVGESERERLLLRSGAREGDVVFLGRPTGESAAGLRVVLGEAAGVSEETRRILRRAHLEPEPQLELGRLLAQEGLSRAAIDVSDGLLQDLGHICEESGLGAEIDEAAVPLSEPLRRFAAATGGSALDLALSGGEDYALLFCVPPESAGRCRERCRERLGLEVYPIGRMCARKGLWLRSGTGLREVAPRGYDAFREGLTEETPAEADRG